MIQVFSESIKEERRLGHEAYITIRKSLEGELNQYEELGIALYLEGLPSDARAIAKACQIADGGGYMRDYTEDENGHIARVDFDFVIDDQQL